MEELLERYESARARPPVADPRQTLLPMLDGLSRALGFERALVALYDPQARVLRGRLGLNVPESIAESLEVPVHDLGHPLTIALRDGLPQRVDDAGSDARLLWPDVIARYTAAGLLEADKNALRLSPGGLAVADALAAEFLQPAQPAE